MVTNGSAKIFTPHKHKMKIESCQISAKLDKFSCHSEVQIFFAIIDSYPAHMFQTTQLRVTVSYTMAERYIQCNLGQSRGFVNLNLKVLG